jgi:hypothetical protein
LVVLSWAGFSFWLARRVTAWVTPVPAPGAAPAGSWRARITYWLVLIGVLLLPLADVPILHWLAVRHAARYEIRPPEGPIVTPGYLSTQADSLMELPPFGDFQWIELYGQRSREIGLKTNSFATAMAADAGYFTLRFLSEIPADCADTSANTLASGILGTNIGNRMICYRYEFSPTPRSRYSYEYAYENAMYLFGDQDHGPSVGMTCRRVTDLAAGQVLARACRYHLTPWWSTPFYASNIPAPDWFRCEYDIFRPPGRQAGAPSRNEC